MTDYYLQQDLNATGKAAPQTFEVTNNFPTAYKSSLPVIPKSPGFTIVGMATFAIILWVVSQNATGSARKIINGFLGVLLLSMLLLNWSKIKPIFFKS